MKPLLFHKSRKGKKSKNWSIRFQCDGMLRPKEVNLHVSDKQIAHSKATRLIFETEQELLGLIAPKAARDATVILISEHLECFLDDCRAIGRGKRYTKNLKTYISIACRECGWNYLQNISAMKFVRWRAKSDLSGKTLNEYLSGLNVFLNWLLDNKMILENPLSMIKRVDTRRDEKNERRAFSIDELTRFVNVASPINRAAYLLAAYNGLRRNEILQLEWNDLTLVGDSPAVALRAAITKNAKSFVSPLRYETVNALLAIKPIDGAMGMVFPVLPRLHRMVAKDWKAAGIALIDNDGRRADFHSLRKTFCTMMQMNDTTARVAQELMRHSDPRLTAGIYTDASQFNLRKVVDDLPSVMGGEKCPPICPPNLVPQRLTLSHFVTLGKEFQQLQVVDNVGSCHQLSRCDIEKESGRGSRIRTCDPLVPNQMR